MKQAFPVVIEAQEVNNAIANMAKANISTIKIKKEEIKEKKGKLEDQLMEYEEYRNSKEVIKNANQAKKSAKAKALENPLIYKLYTDIQGLTQELKDKQLSLFDYLGEYTKKTGLTEIIDNTGERHEITITAKIKI